MASCANWQSNKTQNFVSIGSNPIGATNALKEGSSPSVGTTIFLTQQFSHTVYDRLVYEQRATKANNQGASSSRIG
jgi:hypothetical protein